jgi:hypothetical protein
LESPRHRRCELAAARPASMRGGLIEQWLAATPF